MQRFSPAQFAQYSKAAPSSSENEDLNKPLPYFGSPAERYRGAESRQGYTEYGWPSYQPYVINGSIAIFLIYFCVLREENDIDEKLGGNLYDHVPDMELVQLKRGYIYNQENNLSNDGIEKRLKELGVPLARLFPK